MWIIEAIHYSSFLEVASVIVQNCCNVYTLYDLTPKTNSFLNGNDISLKESDLKS